MDTLQAPKGCHTVCQLFFGYFPEFKAALSDYYVRSVRKVYLIPWICPNNVLCQEQLPSNYQKQQKVTYPGKDSSVHAVIPL